MKKLFFAALIALAGFTACGTKNVETAATEATEQREVGGGDIAYVQVEAVLAQSDLYNAEGIALKDKTEKATEELGTEGAELPVRSSPAPGEIPKGAYHHQRRAIHTGEHRAPHSFVPGCGTEGSQSARRREFRLLEPGSGPAAPRHREP